MFLNDAAWVGRTMSRDRRAQRRSNRRAPHNLVGAVIGLVPRPVPLKFEQHLNPDVFRAPAAFVNPPQASGTIPYGVLKIVMCRQSRHPR
jgi:hypothetical protein